MGPGTGGVCGGVCLGCPGALWAVPLGSARSKMLLFSVPGSACHQWLTLPQGTAQPFTHGLLLKVSLGDPFLKL